MRCLSILLQVTAHHVFGGLDCHIDQWTEACKQPIEDAGLVKLSQDYALHLVICEAEMLSCDIEVDQLA